MLDMVAAPRSLSRGAAVGKQTLGGEAVSRSLVAIIAADVAGYSRLMEADEEEALALLRSRHHDPDRSELDKGRKLETTGDGMLIEFADAVQAARIAAG